jgi:hypothetical protein
VVSQCEQVLQLVLEQVEEQATNRHGTGEQQAPQPRGKRDSGCGKGGKIHQLLWRQSRAVSDAIQELSGQER